MDNLFFNASHSNRPPNEAFERPKLLLKWASGDALAPDADTFEQEHRGQTSGSSGKLQGQLPPPPTLREAANPNQARAWLGLSTLPRSTAGDPRPLGEASKPAPQSGPDKGQS